MPALHLTRGNWAEKHALEYLIQQGLRLIQRNFKTKLGEIDLIMVDQNTLVFVEVRLRSNDNYGSAAESVNTRKQNKMISAAEYYLQYHSNQQTDEIRFDVIAFSLNHHQTTLEWIQDAFFLDN